MNFHNFGINKGKIVYWVNGQRFENEANKRNGKQNAINYCLENFIDTNEIIKFDSRTEANYYEYLLEQEKLGNLNSIKHHYTILIQPEYTNCVGDLIPAITYEADFVYKDKQGGIQVVDVKGSTYFIDERFITIKQVFDNKFKEKNKEIFANGLNSEIAYELHARSEYECYIKNGYEWNENGKGKDLDIKIDPYQQVKMNWEQFVDYCWENKKLFRQFKKANKTLKELNNERY